MRPDERLPTKRTLSMGSRVPPAVTRTRSPSQGRAPAGTTASTAASSSAGSGRRPAPHSRLEASAPDAGLQRRHAALAQRREVGPRRGVLPHCVVHRRRDDDRARRGERGAREEVVGQPVGELGERVRARGGHEVRVGVAHELEVAEPGRAPADAWSGKRPARGSRSNSSMSTGAPVSAANDAAPTNRWRVGRLDHADRVPGLRGQADELERLVGGDPAADPEQDARHGGPRRSWPTGTGT